MPDTAAPARPVPVKQASWWRRLGTNPAVRTFGPFVPVVLAWWVAAESALFPEAFFVGPTTVLAEFADLINKGILPSYLSDSLTRLWTGVVFGLLIGLPASWQCPGGHAD
jgi:NitT/TauT family transport system permease protein/taurine transport system permease protein